MIESECDNEGQREIARASEERESETEQKNER